MAELLPAASPAAAITKDRQAIYETIVTALLHRQRLRLQYRERAGRPVSTTFFELYQLVMLEGQWALVGHSSFDLRVRLFWLTSIESARATGEDYVISPAFRLEKFLKELEAPRSAHLEQIRLRFDVRVLPSIREIPGKSVRMMPPASDGTIELVMHVESAEQIVPWVLGFGDEVEVIEPEELRNAVWERAKRIAQRYENRPA